MRSLKETLDIMKLIKDRDYNDEFDIICDNGKFYIQSKMITLVSMDDYKSNKEVK